jgi:hypothetical protein
MGGIRSIEFSFISPGPSPGENAGEPIRHQRGVRIKRTLKKRLERAGRDKIGFSLRNFFGQQTKLASSHLNEKAPCRTYERIWSVSDIRAMRSLTVTKSRRAVIWERPMTP